MNTADAPEYPRASRQSVARATPPTRITADAHPPPRVVEAKRLEPKVLGITGGALLALAGYFTWSELDLPPQVLMLAGTAAAAAIAAMMARRRQLVVGPALLLASAVGSGVWYALTREPLLLWGSGLSFLSMLAFAVTSAPAVAGESRLAPLHRFIAWYGTAVAGLSTTFALYFQVFDASETSAHGFVARRAVLTFTWLLSGLVLALLGRKRSLNEMRDAGFLVIAAAVGKLVLYDVLHSDGALRIGALAVAGLLLLGASRAIATLTQAKAA